MGDVVWGEGKARAKKKTFVGGNSRQGATPSVPHQSRIFLSQGGFEDRQDLLQNFRISFRAAPES